MLKSIIYNRDFRDNILIRMLLFPFAAPRKKYINRQYLKTKYPEIIKSFKNRYLGKRCFIIGNGPSLKGDDLSSIANEYSFAANKIYSIYDRTTWRPSFYLCMDTVSSSGEIDNEIQKIEAKKSFFNWTAYKQIGDKKDIIYAVFNPEYIVNLFDFKGTYISEECEKKFSNALTVTFSSIQLAIYMGFKEIYLLGVDFSYPYYKDRLGRKHCTEVTETHFTGGDYNNKNNICYLLKYTNENGFRAAKEYCDKNGIIIKNLTRGGKLEIFERDTLENVLNNTSGKKYL